MHPCTLHFAAPHTCAAPLDLLLELWLSVCTIVVIVQAVHVQLALSKEDVWRG